jgi:hypothetical protein
MNKDKKGTLGKIYILRNSAFKDGVVKIGLTERNSEIRSNEISSATGVPIQFEVLFEDDVLDVKMAEKKIHQRLEKYRVNPKREFFKLPLKLAVKTVFDVCFEVNNEIANGVAEKIGIIINSPVTEEQLKNLKSILEANQGPKIKVYLLLQNTRSTTVISLPDTSNISISAGMISKIKEIPFVKEVIWKATSKSLANNTINADGK